MDSVHKFLYSRGVYKKHVYHNVHDFIPFACHYNESTLLTKNGELIQSFRIDGITTDNINSNLENLRSSVRKAIKNNNYKDASYWVHNIRHCINIDDSAPYEQPFAHFIHQTWSKKNHLQNKFVNTLYISIVHYSYDLGVKDLAALLNPIYSNSIDQLHDNFLNVAIKKLSTLTQNLMHYLKEFNPYQLMVRVDNDSNVYSELLSLYNRVMHANWDLIKVEKSDNSLSLDTHQYSFGTNTIELSRDTEKKFATVISIKEYQEISGVAVSRCINVPIDLVATEIFYLVDKGDIPKQYRQQNKVLSLTKNSELIKLKNINDFIDRDVSTSASQICNQQISIMVNADSIEKLEARVISLSNHLIKQGIVHVREDINLEQTFWSQLPGNFKYIKRSSPNTINHIAALATLYECHTGSQQSLWGRAVTVLRTEFATPYFMNFHDKNKLGHTCIIGTLGAGCTTIMNFLLSEASKYNPNILYFSTHRSSQIFIEAMNGTWYDSVVGVNVLLDADYTEILDYLKIIAGHYTNKMDDNELAYLEEMAQAIANTEAPLRSLQKISKVFSWGSSKVAKAVKARLHNFIDDGKYSAILSNTNTILQSPGITAIDLYKYTDAMLLKKYFDQNKKYTDEYYAELQELRCLRSVVLLALIRRFCALDVDKPKILVIEDIEEVIFVDIFIYFIESILTKLTQSNGIVLSSVKIHKESKFIYSDFLDRWLTINSSKIILPIKLFRLGVDVASIFKLNNTEIDKLKSFPPYTRLFLIKQFDHSVAVELNLEGFPEIKRFLSANNEDLDKFNQIKEKSANQLEWVNTLYKYFQDSSSK